MNRQTFSIIGAGVVGSSVATHLVGKGYTLAGVSSRSPDRAKQLAEELGGRAELNPWDVTKGAELIFITTPDTVIGEVCRLLLEHGILGQDKTVIHMSGALSTDELSPAREAGARVLSLHPLQSFARKEEALANLPGSVFSLEGDAEAVQTGFQLVDALGGTGFVIAKDHKVLYHGAAVIVSNYLVALAHLGVNIFEKIGFPPEDATRALVPLMEGVLRNISSLGPTKALTGPVARGDIPTVEGHLAAISALNSEKLEIYKVLGIYTVDIALEKGTINREKANHLRKVLKGEE